MASVHLDVRHCLFFCLSSGHKYRDNVICPDVARFMIHVSSFDFATICMTSLCGMIAALCFFENNLEREACIMKHADKINFVCILSIS